MFFRVMAEGIGQNDDMKHRDDEHGVEVDMQQVNQKLNEQQIIVVIAVVHANEQYYTGF